MDLINQILSGGLMSFFLVIASWVSVKGRKAAKEGPIRDKLVGFLKEMLKALIENLNIKIEADEKTQEYLKRIAESQEATAKSQKETNENLKKAMEDIEIMKQAAQASQAESKKPKTVEGSKS